VKICDRCGKERKIWKNLMEDGERRRLCKECWSCQTRHSLKPTKVKKPIAPRSHKRAKQEKEYSAKRRIFMQDNPICQANISGLCTTQSTDVHHVMGRSGELLLEVAEWLSVCRACHMWIETHPIEATELGFRKSKTV
jgi:hypothetical protein